MANIQKNEKQKENPLTILGIDLKSIQKLVVGGEKSIQKLVLSIQKLVVGVFLTLVTYCNAENYKGEKKFDKH